MMKKSFMNNIKNFVDSNVRQRIDRAANNNSDFFGDDLILVERQFEELKCVCIEAEKRIYGLLQSVNSNSATLVGTYTQNVQASLSNLTTATTSPQPATSGQTVMQIRENQINKSKQSTNIISNLQSESKTSGNIVSQTSNESNELIDDIKKHKKLPIVGFLRFLNKSNSKLKQDSLLSATFSKCSKLQSQLANLFLGFEQTIELHCLKPIQQILEVDVPNVIKLRKIFIKSHNDLESVKAKYNGANQKHLQHQSQQQSQLQSNHTTGTSYTIGQSNTQQANAIKVEHLKKEFDEALNRFEQARDTYAAELYAFVCKETQLVNLFMEFYRYQAEYHQNVASTIQGSMPLLDNLYAGTPRRSVFGCSLDEHLHHSQRSKSLVIELCIHLLYANGLNEEGLFRIPGSSIKIKKLKNAINAWFVTLASQNELDNNPQSSLQLDSSYCSASVLAIYNLFKDIVAQRPQQQPVTSAHGDNSQSTTGRDDSTLTNSFPPPNNNTNQQQQQQQQLVFDVHSIAGLLKLYLRELPEPLFTHALYDQWLDITVKTLNEELNETSLEQLISKLPRTNYENLRHLIRFLHTLTCHCNQNKMTATNLAITMAPSLIWARPQNLHHNQDNQSDYEFQQQNDNHQQQQYSDDIQALNMQMSNVGLSASMHALVIENLIRHAERLFPGPIEYTITGLINYEQELVTTTDSSIVKQDRFQKSTSPTGLSTASSSSFSSSSSKTKQHSRKGGSMEGLLNDNNNVILATKQQFASVRPLSVNLSAHKIIEKSQHGQAPPVPPAPTVRSHLRNTCDQLTHRTFSSHQKPPAPPPPPSSSTLLKRTNQGQPSADNETTAQTKEDNSKMATTQYSKGNITTTTHSSGSGGGGVGGTNVTRPNVPPPNRPMPTCPVPNNEVNIDNRLNNIDNDNITKLHHGANLVVSDNKSSHSLSSSDNLRTDFEEINADDIEISVSVSPVVSLNSISAEDVDNDDSSFDNDSHSLENSWADCGINNPETTIKEAFFDKQTEGCAIPSTNLLSSNQIESNSSTSGYVVDTKNYIETKLKEQDTSKHDSLQKPPIKPARSVSPKQTHSTPL